MSLHDRREGPLADRDNGNGGGGTVQATVSGRDGFFSTPTQDFSRSFAKSLGQALPVFTLEQIRRQQTDALRNPTFFQGSAAPRVEQATSRPAGFQDIVGEIGTTTLIAGAVIIGLIIILKA